MATLVPKKHVLAQIKSRNWIILAVVLGVLLMNFLIGLGIYVLLKDLKKGTLLSRHEFDHLKKEVSEFKDEVRSRVKSLTSDLMKSQATILNRLNEGDREGNSKNSLVPQRLDKLDQLIGLLQEKMASSDLVLRRQQEGMERLYETSQNYRKDIVTELIELKAFRQEYQKELQQLKEQSQEAWREMGSLRELSNVISELRAGSPERMFHENSCGRVLGHMEEMNNNSIIFTQVHEDTSEQSNQEGVAGEVEEKGPTKFIKKGVKKAKKVFESVVSFFGGKLGFKKSLEEESSEGIRIPIDDVEVPEEMEIIEDIQVNIEFDRSEGDEPEKKGEKEREFMEKLNQLVRVSESIHNAGDFLPEKMLTYFAYLEAKFEDINALLEDHQTSFEGSEDWLQFLRKEYEALQQSYFSTKKNFDGHHGFAQKPHKLHKQWKKFFTRVRDLDTSLSDLL